MKRILFLVIVALMLTVPVSAQQASGSSGGGAKTNALTTLTPSSAGSLDIGSSSKWFQDLYFGHSGTYYAKQVATPTANRTYTWPDKSGTVAMTSDISASGATTALDNLASVAINAALLPASNNSLDFGSSSKWWKDLYFGTSGSFYAKLTITPTANRTVTFPDASFTVARSDAAQTLTGTQTIAGNILFDSSARQIGFVDNNTGIDVSGSNLRIKTYGGSLVLRNTNTNTDAFTLSMATGNFGLGGLTNTFYWADSNTAIKGDNGSNFMQFRYYRNGTSGFEFYDTGTSAIAARVLLAASAVNYPTLQNSATTSAVTLSAAGLDSDISLSLAPKGNGKLQIGAVTFANLGTPSNGAFIYCSDCTIANPCAGSGTGAFAKRLNGVWVCN